MKVAYLDLNFSDLIESYSINKKSNRYGGGSTVAKHLKELLSDFHIYADAACFEFVGKDEKWENCHILTEEQREKLRNNHAVETVIPEIKNYDVILHHFTNYHLNTLIPQVVWAVGYGDIIHPEHQHLILYNNHQNPQIYNKKINIHYARIGIDLPPISEYRNKFLNIFQCSRLAKEFGPNFVAQTCLRYNIKCAFAGPIDANNPNFVEEYIDNKILKYHGLITEIQKDLFTSLASATPFIHSWNTPFSLGAIHSLALGTPIIATKVGFWTDLVEDGVNGFLIEPNPEAFRQAIYKCDDLDPEMVRNSALPFSKEKMKDDYERVLLEILN